MNRSKKEDGGIFQSVSNPPCSSLENKPSSSASRRQSCNPTGSCCRDYNLMNTCYAIAIAVIIIGLVNLLGIYVWPPKSTCFNAIYTKEFPGSKPYIPGVSDKDSAAAGSSGDMKAKVEKIKDICSKWTHVYTILNLLFMLVSMLAGIFLMVAVFNKQRRSKLSWISCMLLLIANLFGSVQALLIYRYSEVRYHSALEGLQQDALLYEPSKVSQVAPYLSENGQKALSLVACLLFFLLYLYFAFCAWVLPINDEDAEKVLEDEDKK